MLVPARSLLRRTLRHAADLGAYMTGELARRERRARAGLSVLTYHRVLPDAQCAGYPISSLVVSTSAFERQVAWLARHCDVLPMREALERWRGTPASGADRPIVSITFDDGYEDNYRIAAPVLERDGLRGTFFVTTGFVLRKSSMWFDRAALHWLRSRDTCRQLAESEGGQCTAQDAWMEFLKALTGQKRSEIVLRLDASDALRDCLRSYGAMTIEQVSELHRRGHEIGSHTVGHEILTSLSTEHLARELRDSRRAIRDWLGEPVVGFCYPNGDHDDRCVAAVEEAGYGYACCVEPGLNVRPLDAYRIRRTTADSGSMSGPTGRPSALALRSELFGFHDRLREQRRGGRTHPAR